MGNDTVIKSENYENPAEDLGNNSGDYLPSECCEFTITINERISHKKDEIIKALTEQNLVQVDVLEILHITAKNGNVEKAREIMYKILARGDDDDEKPRDVQEQSTTQSDVLEQSSTQSDVPEQPSTQSDVDEFQQKVRKSGDNDEELEIMKSLLAELEIADEEEIIHDTPLHLASRLGKKELVEKIFSDYSASPDALGSNFRSPLHLAAKNGHFDIVELLIGRNASINAKEKDDWTPLHYASNNGHVNIVKVLLINDAEIDSPDKKFKCNPLHLAAMNGHIEVVDLLLQNNAPIDAKSFNNFTPLHFAAKNGHSNILKCLLDKNVDVNAQNSDGYTALHYATLNGNLMAVKELIAHGADVHVKNNNDEAPFILAYKSKHFEIVKLLSEKIQA